MHIIKRELERQTTEDHQCAANPCSGMRRIQSALDAIANGEPLLGWIGDGKLHIIPASSLGFAYEPTSPLATWLDNGGITDAVPDEIIIEQLIHEKAQHACLDTPCAALQRLQAVLDAIDCGTAVTGYIKDGKLLIRMGKLKEQAIDPTNDNTSTLPNLQ